MDENADERSAILVVHLGNLTLADKAGNEALDGTEGNMWEQYVEWEHKQFINASLQC